MSDPITFTANLAGLNTAARWLAVDSDGASKIVLEASYTELASVMRLALLAKTSLRVTIEPHG